jgi:formylglycine-generating enzyme required for sulfatase activity
LQAALAAGQTSKFDPGSVVIAGYRDDFVHTSPVGSFEANPFGLYDMGGNVIQWCEDLAAKEGQDRVLRGQAWSSLYVNIRAVLRSSLRNYVGPNFRSDHSGFRIVLEVREGASEPTDHTAVTPSTTSQPTASKPPRTAPSGDPAKASKDTPYVNTLGMKFVPVSGTSVLFCIHETRRQDYAVYAAEVAGVDRTWKEQGGDGFIPTDSLELHPVKKVMWEDAQRFCAWLSKEEGRTYRLPTDQEWSIAVGIGSSENWKEGTTPATVFKNESGFPWGDPWPPPQGSGNYSDQSRKTKAPSSLADTSYLESYDDGFPTTAPVMSFQPNQLGIYDLGGNVWEWCADLYDKTNKTTGKDRVIRGGSWSEGTRNELLSSYRRHFGPVTRYYNRGFRCVLEIASQSTPAQTAPTP